MIVSVHFRTRGVCTSKTFLADDKFPCNVSRPEQVFRLDYGVSMGGRKTRACAALMTSRFTT